MREGFTHKFGGVLESEAYYWCNPDGKTGGVVATSARIPPETIIPIACTVWPDAVISPNVELGHGVTVGKGSFISSGNRQCRCC